MLHAFGKLDDTEQEAKVIESGGRVLNYHPSFVDTLMGWRLFQLDSLIIDPDSWDLVREGRTYVLGAGETAPNIEENKKGLRAFRRFEQENRELFESARSYLISDLRRKVVFDVQGNRLNIQGEPSYYFFHENDQTAARQATNRAKAEEQLLAELREFRRTHPTARIEKWLIEQLIAEAESYDRLVGDYDLIAEMRQPELQNLLSTKGPVARRSLLSGQSAKSLVDQLHLLRILASMGQPEEVRELSERVSKETGMLRAINPAVWDAGVNLLRYAAFFRYCKRNHPGQWALFMRQIQRAPAPQPSVATFTVMEAPLRPKRN